MSDIGAVAYRGCHSHSYRLHTKKGWTPWAPSVDLDPGCSKASELASPSRQRSMEWSWRQGSHQTHVLVSLSSIWSLLSGALSMSHVWPESGLMEPPWYEQRIGRQSVWTACLDIYVGPVRHLQCLTFVFTAITQRLWAVCIALYFCSSNARPTALPASLRWLQQSVQKHLQVCWGAAAFERPG